MILGRYGTFAGGIDLPDEKQATLNAPVEPYALKEPLHLPLAPCGYGPAQPLVAVGQRVAAHQKLAAAQASGGVDIFCPTAGRVTALGEVHLAAGDAFRRVRSLAMQPDKGSYAIGKCPVTFDWRSADSADLRRRICEPVLMTCRRPVWPLADWINHARSQACDHLVLNAMENQPYVTAGHRLLVETGAEVLRGLAILARAMEVPDVILAVDSQHTSAYQQIVEPARVYQITRVALPHKYPTGADAILTKVLTRRETPPGGSTRDVGVAVIDPATCLAVYRWVACQIPPTGRMVTLAGPRVDRPRNTEVPFGASCSELIGRPGPPMIHGGAMNGLRCTDDAVVGPATDAVLALAVTMPATATACIRCGWCTDHCPARLNVAALNDAFELGFVAQAQKLQAAACVECGVCSYVCPARLPLSQRVKQLKRVVCSMKNTMPLFSGV